ncbi:MAG: PaaI family thioesterase [Candidatus Rhabdochlamydia sp.]
MPENPIWKTTASPEELQRFCHLSLVDHLGIRFTSIRDRSLEATLVIHSHHLQPRGIVHGGVWAALAETVASVAANLAIDQAIFYAVGVNLTINHLKSISSGTVTAIATADHIGRSTQVWSVHIQDEKQALVAVGRLTVSNLKK